MMEQLRQTDNGTMRQTSMNIKLFTEYLEENVIIKIFYAQPY